MTFIDLKPFTSNNSTDDLLNKFKSIDRMENFANDKVTDILDKLYTIIDYQNYFGASVLNETNREFIFVSDKNYLPQLVTWMSTLSVNQLRDIVNRILFVYNTKILKLNY